MSDQAAAPAGTDRRTRRTLLLILAVGIAPVIASYSFYYFSPREAQVNYGELLPTRAAPAIEGKLRDGRPFRLADLRGRWVIVVATAGVCDTACVHALYATRQARTMQGREQDRVARVWLAGGDETPPEALLAEHPGLPVVAVRPEAIAAFPGGAGRIYLIDPLGNQVIAWPLDPDIKGVAKDLGRLLKASQIG